MEKDILLVQCPFEKRIGIGNVFPLGIGYLMKALEISGYTFDFYDCAYTEKNIDSANIERCINDFSIYLQNHHFTVIALSGITTGAIKFLSFVIDACRIHAPDSIIIMGGPLPSIEETVKVFFDNYDIDGIIRGEGEEVLPEFLCHIKSGNQFDSFFGLTTKERMGPLNLLKDINRIPIPYRDSQIMQKYSVSRKRRLFSKSRAATIITSRGCPCSCFYCVSGNSRHRKFAKRAWDNIAEEIRILVKEYEVDNIVFYDDCFFPNKLTVNNDVKDFLFEVDRAGCKGEFFWQNELRADVVANMSEESLKAMYDAGCRQINLGIETHDSGFLRYLGKTVSVEDAYRACNNIRDYTPKMIMGGTFIVGGPNVNRETVLETARFSCDLGLHFVNYFPLELHPGTPLYKDIHGDSDEWFQTIIHQKNHSQCLLYENPKFPELELKKAVDEAYAMFYSKEWEERLGKILKEEYEDVWSILKRRNTILQKR